MRSFVGLKATAVGATVAAAVAMAVLWSVLGAGTAVGQPDPQPTEESSQRPIPSSGNGQPEPPPREIPESWKNPPHGSPYENATPGAPGSFKPAREINHPNKHRMNRATGSEGVSAAAFGETAQCVKGADTEYKVGAVMPWFANTYVPYDWEGRIRNEINEATWGLYWNTHARQIYGTYYSQRIRWECVSDANDGNYTVKVRHLYVTDMNGNNLNDWGDIHNTLRNTSPYNRLDRKWAVFPDDDCIQPDSPHPNELECGSFTSGEFLGEGPPDRADITGSTSNLANRGRVWTVIQPACWENSGSANDSCGGIYQDACCSEWPPGLVLLHELSHAFGATKNGAPDSPPCQQPGCPENGGRHAVDGPDVNGFGSFNSPCGHTFRMHYDCMANSYYDPVPSVSEWLCNNFNQAHDSLYLTNRLPYCYVF